MEHERDGEYEEHIEPYHVDLEEHVDVHVEYEEVIDIEADHDEEHELEHDEEEHERDDDASTEEEYLDYNLVNKLVNMDEGEDADHVHVHDHVAQHLLRSLSLMEGSGSDSD